MRRNASYIIILIILVVIVGVLLWWFTRDVGEDVPDEQPSPEVTEEMSERHRGPLPGFEHDIDRDGLPDEVEAVHGTSNASSDTDGDGLSDKVEVEVWGTDPTDIDSDGDGYADALEIISGFDPNGDGKLPE